MIASYWALYTDEIDGFVNGSMVVGTAWPVNFTYTEADAPVDAVEPVRGHDRLGRHVDDLGERAAPELHAHVDGLHAPARRPGGGGGVLRRGGKQRRILRRVADADGRLLRRGRRCRRGHAQAGHCGDAAFLDSLHLWKTPQVDCGDDRGDVCIDYSEWTAGLDRDPRRASTTGVRGNGAAFGRSPFTVETGGDVASEIAGTRRRPDADARAPSCSAIRGVKLGLSLGAPLAWMVVVYLGSLVLLLASAFWRLDVFTSEIVHDWSLANFRTLAGDRRLSHDHAADGGDRRRRHA